MRFSCGHVVRHKDWSYFGYGGVAAVRDNTTSYSSGEYQYYVIWRGFTGGIWYLGEHLEYVHPLVALARQSE